MAIMPISDYPAPASDKAQAQVLSERKGELKEKLQAVQQSNLPAAQKEQASDSIGGQISGVERQRQRKLRNASHQESQEQANAHEAQVKQAALEQEDAQRAKTRRALDTQA